ncbi:DUF456 domain-containing protein [Brevibacillus sp. TJ4]|uniref:DUF456 domain-containing protein n=1 Tax=Brevibacillus sp. TJ4 TaxID=3234853 RepID=UPI003B9EFCB4
MTDQDERMTAKREEETGFSERANLEDTEFAADTWTRAVFNTEGTTPEKGNGYDSNSRTNRYTGELVGEEAEVTGQPVNTVPGRLEAVDRGYNPGVDDALGDDRVEASAEVAEPPHYSLRQSADREERRERPENGTSGVGVTGLVLSILSLFLWPYLLGAVGIVLGYMAYRRNAKTLGAWAMIIGAIAIVGALLIYPFFTAR